jgi:hypothetical protein
LGATLIWWQSPTYNGGRPRRSVAQLGSFGLNDTMSIFEIMWRPELSDMHDEVPLQHLQFADGWNSTVFYSINHQARTIKNTIFLFNYLLG